jgi:hypothetical protein
VATLANLEAALSIDRFSSYVTASQGDRQRAITFYEWNSQVSAAFYVPLQAVEVALRNACHRELSTLFGSSWYDNLTFQAIDGYFTQSTEDAKKRLRRFGAPIDAPHIVPELSFGFWATLLARRFEHSLWSPALRRAFPRIQAVSGLKPSRRFVADRFDYLRVFRNRIAHHEPIFSRDLSTDYASLLEVAAWMFPDIAEWTDSLSACAHLIAAKPSLK